MFVTALPGETFEELFKRFKRGVQASGIVRDHVRAQRFIPAHEERRAKLRNARRKQKRRGGD